MNLFIAFPVLVPLVVFIGFWFNKLSIRKQAASVNVAASSFHLAVCTYIWLQVWKLGNQVLTLGNWPAPFGIVFVADLFSVSMIWISSFIGFCVALFIWSESSSYKTSPYYVTSYQILLAGVCGSFLAGDLFNLYVWFEVMLMASFVMIAFEKSKAQLEGALKYTILNLLASTFFVIGIGLIYSALGTLNLAQISKLLFEGKFQSGVLWGYLFLFVAFCMKAGVFPLFFWLPSSYHTPRAATSALIAGLLTKVGVYSLFRISTLMAVVAFPTTGPLLTGLACLTMITGVLGSLYHYEMKKILAFHIISQIGYIVLSLSIGTPLALAAGIFYIFHHIIVKTNLFLISGVIKNIKGSTDLKSIGSLYVKFPYLAWLFLIPALSLAGMPPLSGFFAKFGLIQSGLISNYVISISVALLVGLLTLISMLKIWNEAFLKPQPIMGYQDVYDRRLDSKNLIVITIMTCLTVGIGLWPNILFLPSRRMALELANPSIYIESVFRESTQ